MRVRTGDMYYGGGESVIYFRISSVNFNWFDIIWNIAYENKNSYKAISIYTDEQSLGEEKPYYHNGEKLVDMDINEFINLSGNPVIEKVNRRNNIKSLTERLGKMNVHNFLKEYELLKEINMDNLYM